MGLQGAKELDKKLQELGASMALRVLRSALRTALREPLKAARDSAPVGKQAHKTYKGRLVAPGFTKRSLKISVAKPRDGKVRAVLGVQREAYYSLLYLELGTSRIARRPWLVPAFERTKDQQVAKLVEALKKRIERIASKRS